MAATDPLPQPDPSVDLLAASLRLDTADLSLYAGFLLSTLSGALPAEMVRVERRRSLKQRLAGSEGDVVEVSVQIDDRRYTLRRERLDAAPTATVAHEVGGVVLSRQQVALDAWARELATGLLRRAESSAAAREALERMLLPGAGPALPSPPAAGAGPALPPGGPEPATGPELSPGAEPAG